MTTVTLDQALSRGHGKWRSFTCPVHDDANPSARVNVETGKWVCMSCGAKGGVDGYVPDYDRMLEDALEALDQESLQKPQSWLDQFDANGPGEYWLSRFSEDVCREFRLGYDWATDQPCYPIRAMNGQPLGVVLRNLSDPEGPKYKYPKGVRTTELVFGFHEAQQVERLFVVEGATDVFAVREAGHDALGVYGSNISGEQVRIIASLHPLEVVVAMDMDKAGRTGGMSAVAMLNEAGVLARRGWWNDRHNDLGEMDLATRSNTLQELLASSPTRY